LQIINPLFTSYPSRIWPTFVDMLKGDAAASQHPCAQLVDRSRNRRRLHVGHPAGDSNSSRALVVAQALSCARPLSGRRQCHAETAFVPLFYIWLGATFSVYGMSLAISLFITVLMIYKRIPRHRS